MAPVVTGDLKSSVRVRLRRHEAGWLSFGRMAADSSGMSGPGDTPGGEGAIRTARARALDRVTDLRARLGPPTPPVQLGDMLVSQGALTTENLHRALDEQQRTAGRLGEILVARGYVHRLDVYRALSDAWGIPHVDLSRHVLDAALIEELGLDLADLAGAAWVPLVHEHGTLVVATTERPSPELEADVRVFAGPVGIAWMVTTELGPPQRRAAVVRRRADDPRLVRPRRPRSRRLRLPRRDAAAGRRAAGLAWPRSSRSASWRR